MNREKVRAWVESVCGYGGGVDREGMNRQEVRVEKVCEWREGVIVYRKYGV